MRCSGRFLGVFCIDNDGICAQGQCFLHLYSMAFYFMLFSYCADWDSEGCATGIGKGREMLLPCPQYYQKSTQPLASKCDAIHIEWDAFRKKFCFCFFVSALYQDKDVFFPPS